MIILDTHIWVWWVHADPRLNQQYLNFIEENENSGLGISIISCWEVAKLVENGRLALPISINEWIEKALGYPGIDLIELTPPIVIDSTKLPGDFHRDPADQMIVSTARTLNVPLVTLDARIISYPHIDTANLA